MADSPPREEPLAADGPAPLLHRLAADGATGLLRLSRPDARAVVVLRHGRILHAASSEARETLGHLLVSLGTITAEQLQDSLERSRAQPDRRLGRILVEMGAVEEGELAGAVRRQISGVVADLLTWRSGVARFEPLAEVDPATGEADDVAVDPRDLLPDLPRSVPAPELPRSGDSPGKGDGAAEAPLDPLRRAMREIVSPEFTGELTLRVLDYAHRLFPRGVLFAATARGFSGIGQFGLELKEGDAARRVRDIVIPATEPSILHAAAERRHAHGERSDASAWNRELHAALGGGPHRRAVAVPMEVSGRVLMVLYADEGDPPERTGPVGELEILLIQAGLAMEKRLLEKRLEQYERLRGIDGSEEVGTGPASG